MKISSNQIEVVIHLNFPEAKRIAEFLQDPSNTSNQTDDFASQVSEQIQNQLNSMKFDYFQFLTEVNHYFIGNNEGQRYGQYVMNYLSRNYPQINIPEDCDCYYDDKKVSKLIEYLAAV